MSPPRQRLDAGRTRPTGYVPGRAGWGSSLRRPRAAGAASSRRIRRALSGAFALALLCLVAFHFVMTALSLMPDSPLREPLQSLVQRYMSPYFAQNWRLFAPDPEEPSKHLVVACRFAEPGAPDSELFDVTQPHYAALQKYRLSPAQRLIRAQLYPLGVLLQHADAPPEPALEDSQQLEAELALRARQLEGREQALGVLGRVASAECQRRYPGASISDVQVLYYRESAPKFSARNAPDARGEVVGMDFGWQPYRRVAAY